MKYIYLLAAFTLSAVSYSQIKVTDSPKTEVIGQNKQMGVMMAELSISGDHANFVYRDLNFKELVEYKNFHFKTSDLDFMYNLLTANGAKQGEEKTVELDNGNKLFITYKKSGKNIYAYATHVSITGVSAILPYFTNKQWNKIFGKSDN
jgi:hypothetical protein